MKLRANLLRVFSYLKRLSKISFKNKERQEKISSVDKESFLIIFFILTSIIYYIITNKIKESFFIIISLLSLYSSYKTFFSNKEIYDYIDLKFQEKSDIEKRKEQEKLKNRNKINRLIVTDKNGKEIENIEITKDKYLIGKKNNKQVIDIDLINVKNSETISKVHSEIFKFENKWYVLDKNSTNGTLLIKNNKKILLKASKEKLMVGDIVKINKNIDIIVN